MPNPRFGQVFPNYGVDEDANWMIVPVNGYNFVLLKHGKNLALRIIDNQLIELLEISESKSRDSILGTKIALMGGATGIVTLAAAAKQAKSANARLFMVVGKRHGDTTISAHDDARGRERTKIELSVRQKHVLKISFNLVEHQPNAQQSFVRYTDVTESRVPRIVKGVNRILVPQVNVQVTIQKVKPARVNMDLGDAVLHVDPQEIASRHYLEKSHEWDDVVRHGDTAADANVFFVKALHVHNYNAGSAHDSSGATAGSDILVPKKSSPQKVERTIAHEIGHLLGLGDMAKGLMGPHGVDTGTNIPKNQAKQFNPPRRKLK